MKIYALVTLLFATLQFGALPITLPFTLEYAPAPGPPQNMITISAVVLTADVTVQGIPANIQAISGPPPFATAAASLLTEWRFRNETRMSRPVSMTFLFRPATIYPADPITFHTPDRGVRPPRDLPPLPRMVIDPGYPATSIAEGPVVLQIDVDVAGVPVQVREIGNPSPLGSIAISGVRQWKFQPALRQGRPVEGTAIAVISFLRPVTE